MYRHSPVRNQRSKGIKIKHVLQICLLLAVCFWLIFQVKRSHDKKREFDASDTKISVNSDEIIKFGRKDLQPKLEEKTKEIGKQEEGGSEEHETEAIEDEENKHEEDEEEDKIEEEKDDRRGGGDDEIDESEQEKSDTEVDREEEINIDEDQEIEESDVKEDEEKDGQSQSQTEIESSLEDHNQDGVTRNTHEAREEHYKADDASSAVTHDAQTVGTESENGTLDNSSENVELKFSELGTQFDNGQSQNSTTELKEKDGESQTTENGASSNTTVIQETVSSDLATTEIPHENGPPLNTTIIISDLTRAPNITEGVTASSDDKQLDSNSTLTKETETSLNSTNISEVLESQTILKSNESTTEENNSGSSEESSTSSETEDPDEAQHDTIDSSDSLSLEVETEGGNSEDTAAE